MNFNKKLWTQLIRLTVLVNKTWKVNCYTSVAVIAAFGGFTYFDDLVKSTFIFNKVRRSTSSAWTSLQSCHCCWCAGDVIHVRHLGSNLLSSGDKNLPRISRGNVILISGVCVCLMFFSNPLGMSAGISNQTFVCVISISLTSYFNSFQHPLKSPWISFLITVCFTPFYFHPFVLPFSRDLSRQRNSVWDVWDML